MTNVKQDLQRTKIEAGTGFNFGKFLIVGVPLVLVICGTVIKFGVHDHLKNWYNDNKWIKVVMNYKYINYFPFYFFQIAIISLFPLKY